MLWYAIAIAATKDADANFSLKGRTLATLQRRKEQWNRALIKEQAICGGSWAGRAQADIDYEAGGDGRRSCVNRQCVTAP